MSQTEQKAEYPSPYLKWLDEQINPKLPGFIRGGTFAEPVKNGKEIEENANGRTEPTVS